MKTRKSFVLLFLVGMLFAACTPASPIALTSTSVPPTPVETENQAPAAALAAQKALADRLGIGTEAVQITEIEQVQWPDACLGLQQRDEACAEMIVDGFRVVVEANGQMAVFHTNFDGSQMREEVGLQPEKVPTTNRPSIEPTPVGKVVEGDLPEAVQNAMDVLATENSVSKDEIKVISVEEVEWSDSCLGVHPPGVMCMQVITPGYRVVFETGGRQYEYHTDDAGGKVIEARSPRPTTSEPALIWEQTENGICTRAEIGFETVSYGPCRGTMKQEALDEARANELAEFADVYSGFEAGTRAGVLTFEGSGLREPTAEEQRAIAEWARALRQQVEPGADEVEPVIFWSRQGGIAGFCDELTVNAGGWVYVASCKGGSKEPIVYRLNTDQLKMLYKWVDTYAPLTIDQADPGAADAMQVKLSFAGQGQQQMPRAEQDALFAFITELASAR